MFQVKDMHKNQLACLCLILLITGLLVSSQASAASIVSDQLQFSPGSISLSAGQSKATSVGTLTMQSDGNLVFYGVNQKPLWESGTGGQSGSNGFHASFQGDGNLVLYNGTKPYWASSTAGHTNSMFVLSSAKPYVCITDKDHNLVLWPLHASNNSPYVLGSSYLIADGHTSDDENLAAAVEAARGGTLVLPAGRIALTGTRTIALNNIHLLGQGVPSNSCSDPDAYGTQGTTFLLTSTTRQPFTFGTSVTIEGCNFYWPEQRGTIPTPTRYPPLFTDNGSPVNNIVLCNDHIINAYDFWNQSSQAATYGNIRIHDCDIYGIHCVLSWTSVTETAAINNVISNPSIYQSIANAGKGNLLSWTEANGVWLHVWGNGTPTKGSSTSIGGIQASNLTVVCYNKGVWVDNGAIDETIFGPTTTFDTVATVLRVDRSGGATRTAFRGRYYAFEHSNGDNSDNAPAFVIDNPSPFSGGTDIEISGTLAGGNGTFLIATGTHINDINVRDVLGENYGGSSTPATYYFADIDAPNARVAITTSNFYPPVADANHRGIRVRAAKSTTLVGLSADRVFNAVDVTGNTGSTIVSANSSTNTSSQFSVIGTAGSSLVVSANSFDRPNPRLEQR